MTRSYFCPYCTATLNPNVKIVLAATCRDRRGLLLLSPHPGNYEAIFSKELAFKDGDLVEFRCPVCNADLQSDFDQKLARINFHTEEGTRGHVNFSRKFGEHATYFITEHEVRSYGEHVALYGGLNFFGVGPDLD